MESIWNLVAKHLAKETNDIEEEELSKLIKNDPSVKKVVDDSRIVWKGIDDNSKKYNKERIKSLIDKKIKEAEINNRKRRINFMLRVAAVFTGLSFLILITYNEYNRKIYYSNNTNKVKKVVLPDNSVVTLNKNAQIAYNNSIFRDFNRELELEGEAFFEIEKNKKGKLFTVQTNSFKITVLGTKFNVRDEKVYTSVMLTEGSVRMNNFTNKNITPVTLKVGEIAHYDKEKKEITIKQTNKAIYTVWLSNKLNFDDFTMQEFIEMIKLRYNKNIVIENEDILNRRISGSAPADNLDLVIEAFKTILETDIIIKQDSIIIK